MTDSPSEEAAAEVEEVEEPAGSDPLAELAAEIGTQVGAVATSAAFGTVKLQVEREEWVTAATKARDEAGLDFFSFLSAIDWANEVAVGDPPAATVEERYEVLCALSNTTDASLVVLAAEVPKDDPTIDSLVPVYGGAEWHEREAAEMFGIEFRGHPNLVKLYLPDAFEGHPLRKSYPLLSREVKPWPGTVDVEDMPSTENPEAGDAAVSEDGEE